MAEKSQKEMIQETHKTVVQISTVLLGVPNTADKGVVGQVKNNTKKITRLQITIAAIVGSGIVGGGIFKLAQLIGG